MDIPPALYAEFRKSMPIACVDILVTNPSGQILLLKRKNDPMQGQWWFPGGRVLFNETRAQAALRKLAEECGLNPQTLNELGTYDVILELKNQPIPSHAITTLFHAQVNGSNPITLDEQSLEAKWRNPQEWQQVILPEFVHQRLLAFEDRL
jgi:colanic acid biosynthesis protein WcaH